MRYASIRNLDISNGSQVGVSLFVQGCDFHCEGCFNKETWDFEGGEVWDKDSEKMLFELIDRPFIKRFSVLGGEPLHYKNVVSVYKICESVKEKYPEKKIWLYTGYKFETICDTFEHNVNDDLDLARYLRHSILQYIDVLVDGQYVHSKRDITLPFRGSSNQRLIDVQETLKQNKIVLYEK